MLSKIMTPYTGRSIPQLCIRDKSAKSLMPTTDGDFSFDLHWSSSIYFELKHPLIPCSASLMPTLYLLLPNYFLSFFLPLFLPNHLIFMSLPTILSAPKMTGKLILLRIFSDINCCWEIIPGELKFFIIKSFWKLCIKN